MMDRRFFLSAVAAGVATALSPGSSLAVDPPIGLHFTPDGKAYQSVFNGTMEMWEQFQSDIQRGLISGFLDAPDGTLDVTLVPSEKWVSL